MDTLKKAGNLLSGLTVEELIREVVYGSEQSIAAKILHQLMKAGE